MWFTYDLGQVFLSVATQKMKNQLPVCTEESHVIGSDHRYLYRRFQRLKPHTLVPPPDFLVPPRGLNQIFPEADDFTMRMGDFLQCAQNFRIPMSLEDLCHAANSRTPTAELDAWCNEEAPLIFFQPFSVKIYDSEDKLFFCYLGFRWADEPATPVSHCHFSQEPQTKGFMIFYYSLGE